MKHWTIYCHTHTDSGRRYIGLTSQTMEKRWRNHTYAAKSSKNGRWHFPNAIRKYGKDAFSHEILEICDTLELANIAESKWIEFYDTRNPEKGFNLAKGGDHKPHPIRKNPWDNPEYRAKMNQKIKDLWEDPEFRIRVADVSRKTWSKPEVLARATDPTERARRSIASTNLWSDPEFRSKCVKPSVEPLVKIQKLVPVEPEPIPGKLCCRCHKPGSFGKDRYTKDGLKLACKECEKIARQNNKENRRAHDRKYRESNREKMRNYQAIYYRNNHSRILNRDRLRRGEINDRVINNKMKLRGMIDEIKKSPCQQCGAPDSLIDFYRSGFKHHSVYWIVNHNCGMKRLLEEINKCEILCVNCYRSRVIAESYSTFDKTG